jgi:hypothetical protein
MAASFVWFMAHETRGWRCEGAPRGGRSGWCTSDRAQTHLTRLTASSPEMRSAGGFPPTERKADTAPSETYTVVVPTVLRAEGFRFFFYSNENDEPPHVHVERGDGTAKFWLEPVELAESVGMKSQELKRARELAQQHEATLVAAWRQHHGP